MSSFGKRVCAASVASVAIGLVACGARGPLDVPEEIFVVAESGADASDAEGAAPTPDGSLAGDAIAPIKDAGGDVASPINCAVCVGESCSNQILACATNQACLNALQCIFGQCLSSGQVNATCALGCSGDGGATAILDVLAILQCVTSACGPDCDSVLAGLGAGLGG